MKRSNFAALLAVMFSVVVAIPAAAQTSNWTAPRTPDGYPDLQGVWASDSATPLERPEELADTATLSDEQVAALQARAAELFDGATDAAFGESVFSAALAGAEDFTSSDRGTGNYNQFWLIDRWFDNRTALIIDPPNGRIPPMTPEAEERQRAAAAARRPRGALPEGPEDSRMRCLGGRVPMTGRGYNSNYQILQSSDHVAILMEMMHDSRIIPIDGRPHRKSDLRGNLGDSRGHYEGDTLVVETTHLKNGRNGSTANMRLIERFTRVAPDVLQYEYTMNDPATWTRPWTARLFMRPTPGTGILYEFACHEGNYAIVNTLRGARAIEREMAEAAK